MIRRPSYRVQEFARLAGVSVRTLHHYDTTGLLAPSARTERGHRRYRQEDLLRLQQILTLRQLGFSLDEIRDLLAAPAYDVRESLRVQLQAIEERIVRLQGVAYALARTAEAVESSREIDWAQVIAAIRGLREADRTEWLRRFYPEQTWRWLERRAAHTPPELLAEGQRAWQELYVDFGAVAHLPPGHAQVQSLAGRAQELIELFTGGDPEVERGLNAMWRDTQQLPSAFQPQVDPAVQQHMRAALEIYRRNKAGEQQEP